MAGKRLGKEDDRHLWPEMLRAIREIQPRWVVGENVLGLVSWSGGLVFHEVQADLEAEGYEVQPFVLPAVSVNAPHRRDRIWFVAHRNGTRFQAQRAEQQATRVEQYGKLDGNATDTNSGTTGTPREGRSVEGNRSADNVQQSERREQTEQHNRSSSFSWDAADTDIDRLQRSVFPGWDDKQGRNRPVESIKEHLHTHGKSRIQNAGWQNFPTVSPICDGNDGISNRLDGITFSKWRQESIKAGGNAVVPQVVLQIFRTIEEYEKMNTQ